jgi:hypothetical protein
MAERTVNVPKILCHPDGAVFCNWHPGDAEVCAVYLSDEDTPPTPESLKIVESFPGIIDHSTLVWKPVTYAVQVGEPGEVAVGGPYDAETGEIV